MAQPEVTPIFEAKADLIQVDAIENKAQTVKGIQDQLLPFSSEVIPNFSRVLDDAMLLLTHAAETGIDVDETTRTSVLNARAVANPDWSYPGAANLLAALATLAAKLRPVTADSLRASCSNLVSPDIRTLRMWTCLLAVPIILFSVLSFVSSSISTVDGIVIDL
jgi:hypothetical protein